MMLHDHWAVVSKHTMLCFLLGCDHVWEKPDWISAKLLHFIPSEPSVRVFLTNKGDRWVRWFNEVKTTVS